MSTYLVTGGAGFIGSNLVHALHARKETVVVLDDFSTGKRKNLGELASDIRLIEGSIADLDTCKEAVRGADYVLHQAALPSVPRSVSDPISSNTVNIDGTLNMLVAARDAGVKRFVYAASSSAYGNTPTLPKVETMPASPLSPYAVSKYAGELYCNIFHRLYGLETICLRYFNVFGPRQDPTSQYSAVIPKFIAAYFQGGQPVIHGDGEQSRDFTAIANVVDANLLACVAPGEAAGRTFNCACGERTTINELAAILAESCGVDISPKHVDSRPGDVAHSHADIASIRQHLGYEPKVSLREGIEETVAWYRRS